MVKIAHRDTRIAEIAARQKRLITIAQLLDLGVSRGAVAGRCRSGRLWAVHAGVFALDPPPWERRRVWLAAVLAGGPGTLLSDEPAAMLQGLLADGPLAAQITVDRSRSILRPGITVHRRPIDPRDIRRVDSIPCTSADRTLVDISPRLDEPQLERIMVAAESLGLLKRHRLAELTAEHRGRPGIHKLESLLAL